MIGQARTGTGFRFAAASFVFGVSALAVTGRSPAADPQPKTVAVASTGNRALDAALNDASQLEALRKKVEVGPFALVARAKEDVGRYESVLQSFGYYAGRVTVTIAGHP
ncbi:MAG: outer membrane protein assembly factor, partial [Thiohalocapsa sp.]